VLRPSLLKLGQLAMENKTERPQSHEDREAQKLVTRIEKTLASEKADRAAEIKRTLDDYGKKVGS
jgi:hypothetical protein